MKVAVVGSGVAGLVVARGLASEHDVVVYEAGAHAGGHVHTHDVEHGGRRYAIDSGFIVFNERTYPRFSRLLAELGVESQPSEMSFSVRDERADYEYNGRDLDALFAQRSNLARPAHYAMLLEILRFHREAPALLEPGEERTLGVWLDERRYGRAFRERYLLPMAAAIWSAPPDELRAFPLRFLVRFLWNHGMLRVADRPQWRVIRGGSKRYVDALIRPFAERIRLRTPVVRVARDGAGVELTLRGGERQRFDEVVLACHSDTALGLLADPTPAEREVLGALRYQENDAVLHTDTSLLPRRRKVWASWNAHLSRDPSDRRAAVTYCMNILQGIASDTTFCVTLNRSNAIDPARVLKRMRYAHPQFTLESARAQARRGEISGVRRTWYCGAYWGFGFHEDGVASADAVVEAFAARRAPVEVRA